MSWTCPGGTRRTDCASSGALSQAGLERLPLPHMSISNIRGCCAQDPARRLSLGSSQSAGLGGHMPTDGSVGVCILESGSSAGQGGLSQERPGEQGRRGRVWPPGLAAPFCPSLLLSVSSGAAQLEGGAQDALAGLRAALLSMKLTGAPQWRQGTWTQLCPVVLQEGRSHQQFPGVPTPAGTSVDSQVVPPVPRFCSSLLGAAQTCTD